MRQPIGLGLALSALLACSSPTTGANGEASDQSELTTTPRFCSVSIVGATIAPTKFTGLPWDGPPFADQAIRLAEGIVAHLAPQYETAANLLALVLRGLIGVTQPPDVRGVVLGVPGGPTQSLPMVWDSYVPQWADAPWTHVALDGPESIWGLTIGLEDVDLGESFGFDTNDQIDAVTLTADDFRKALAAGGTYQVPVAHQGSGQILFVEIIVRPE